ncbi:MAG: hypothetical protein UW69_C0009G0020 [Microgenomates group bacterium GW2011_GWA2_44_7]|nr:MAG: hypothetical protein UW69_C0009G0020 [Microgenomates group bacterium GW2011_GWA2_44_7]KKT78157.1 MAG: hypothetical protein UW73_C0006G0039 [Microgenomates group bacterium GW2011_GWB1_44_8]
MKLFVWDFHGVLEKDNELAVLEITNAILKKFGYKSRLSKEDNYCLTGLKWYEYFEFLLPNEPYARHLELQGACISYQTAHPGIVAQHIKPNEHAHEVLEQISQNHDQIVISNTQPKSLKMFLEAVRIIKFFPSGKSFAADAHGKDATIRKHHILDSYLRDKHYEDKIFIGDSAEDIELVSVAGGKTYLYAHRGKSHKEAKADFKINDLREVLKEV